MDTKKRLPLTKKSDKSGGIKQTPEREDSLFAGPHVGSSDAFLQTENTASSDADNISDEKLDEWVDEK